MGDYTEKINRNRNAIIHCFSFCSRVTASHKMLVVGCLCATFTFFFTLSITNKTKKKTTQSKVSKQKLTCVFLDAFKMIYCQRSYSTDRIEIHLNNFSQRPFIFHKFSRPWKASCFFFSLFTNFTSLCERWKWKCDHAPFSFSP